MQLEIGTFERSNPKAQNRFLVGKSKAVNLADRSIEGIASTINLDRDGEVILPSAFQADIERFLASNAPFGAAHMHRSDDGSPTQIGWVMEASVTKADVTCLFKFAATEIAGEWWALASDPAGKGIAFSIGFIPVRWVYGPVAEIVREFPILKPIFAAGALKDADTVRVYTQIELVEISAVMAPSNRESLQLAAAKLFGATTGADADAAKSEKAMADFAKLLAREVNEDGGADTVEKLVASIGTQIKELAAVVRDGLSEMNELMLLSPVERGSAAHRDHGSDDTPADRLDPDEDTTRPAGDDAGDVETRAAAERLLRAVS